MGTKSILEYIAGGRDRDQAKQISRSLERQIFFILMVISAADAFMSFSDLAFS